MSGGQCGDTDSNTKSQDHFNPSAQSCSKWWWDQLFHTQRQWYVMDAEEEEEMMSDSSLPQESNPELK